MLGILAVMLLAVATPGLVLASQTSAERAQGIFIEASIEPQSPYVQQQVMYTLRLYRDSHLQRGYFLDPDIPEALVLPMPTSEPVVTVYQGREYERIEKRYLLFPQQSGTLQLPAPVFSSQDLFVQGKVLTLDIRPRPAAVTGPDWIIAANLTLTQTWATPPAAWKVGEPLEWTVTVEAEGLTGAQLPEIRTPAIDGLQIQRLGSRLNERLVDGNVTGQRQTRWLLIPERPGQYRIPALRVNWWNSRRDRLVVTELPGRELAAVSAGTVGQSGPDPRAAMPAPRVSAEEAPPSQGYEWQTGFSLVLALLLCLALLGLAVLHYGPAVKSWLQRRQCRLGLSAACQNRDAHQAVRVLIRCANLAGDHKPRLHFPDLLNLAEEPLVRQALGKLDRAIYAEAVHEWLADDEYRALQRFMVSVNQSKKQRLTPDLPALWR